MHHASVYLNRPEDEAEGQLNLVGRSAGHVAAASTPSRCSWRCARAGRKQLASMVDTVLDLTQYAGEAIQARPELELVAPTHTVMVAFRRVGDDTRNIAIHRDLFASGEAVIGRTTVDGRVALKLTLLNPNTTRAQIDALLDLISAA